MQGHLGGDCDELAGRAVVNSYRIAVGIFLVLWLSVRLFTSLRRRVDRKNAATQLTEAVLWQLRREIAGELQRYPSSNARSVPDAGAPLRGQAKPTEVRVRLFVDFPNFEIGWNDFNRGRKRQIDWRRLPTILLDQLPPVAGVSRERLTFVGAHAPLRILLSRSTYSRCTVSLSPRPDNATCTRRAPFSKPISPQCRGTSFTSSIARSRWLTGSHNDTPPRQN